MSANNARHSFRRLLKSAKYAFSHDKVALQQAKVQLKVEFLKHKGTTNPAELQVRRIFMHY